MLRRRSKIMNVVFGITMLLSAFQLVDENEPPEVEAVVLEINGEPEYQRSGWLISQPLQLGTVLNEGDYIHPQGTAIGVVCLGGSYRYFEDLLDMDEINCPTSEITFEGEGGFAHIGAQRGDGQADSVPRIISPRATLVRDEQVELVWHVPPGADGFVVTLFADTRPVWTSERLAAADIANGNIAHTIPDISLESGREYTVEICTTLQGHRVCTTDIGMSEDVDVSFYYVPVSPDMPIALLDSELMGDEPEARLARAELLTYIPEGRVPAEQPQGFYSEAIALLEGLVTESAGGLPGNSPVLYNKLGELYLLVHLPERAQAPFEQALALAPPGGEAAATANLGLALIARRSESLTYFEQALEEYATYLGAAALSQKIVEVCALAGSLCSQLSDCQAQQEQCVSAGN